MKRLAATTDAGAQRPTGRFTPTQKANVLAALRRVHLPGHETDDGLKVYGYIKPGERLDYL
jgi:hypothetical protein